MELLLSQSFIFSCVFKIAGVYCCFENQEVHLTVLMLFESEIQDWFLKEFDKDLLQLCLNLMLLRNVHKVLNKSG